MCDLIEETVGNLASSSSDHHTEGGKLRHPDLKYSNIILSLILSSLSAAKFQCG